mmetsp:Transcript_47263/g.55194  ORF Transcript_47263/g.55194 Transcript_47263/m.55194 type:complete len:109 (+) Transcript_47263:71-397(+)
MGSKLSTGATKKGCTPNKVAAVKNNTVTEEIAAKGVCGHIKDISGLSEIQKMEEEEYGITESDEDGEDGYYPDEESSDEENTADSEEREAILADCHALKVFATAYVHH